MIEGRIKNEAETVMKDIKKRAKIEMRGIKTEKTDIKIKRTNIETEKGNERVDISLVDLGYVV